MQHVPIIGILKLVMSDPNKHQYIISESESIEYDMGNLIDDPSFKSDPFSVRSAMHYYLGCWYREIYRGSFDTFSLHILIQ